MVQKTGKNVTMKKSRLVVLGAGNVGKTSLILRYLKSEYSNHYQPTLEDLYTHTMLLPNGLFHALEIEDTAGKHIFPAMRELSIKNGSAYIVVFAVNNLSSFKTSQEICEAIKSIRSEDDNTPVVLVGNKIDLVEERKVTAVKAMSYIRNVFPQGYYLETSAKYNLYIDNVFQELLVQAYGIPTKSNRFPYSTISKRRRRSVKFSCETPKPFERIPVDEEFFFTQQEREYLIGSYNLALNASEKSNESSSAQSISQWLFPKDKKLNEISPKATLNKKSVSTSSLNKLKPKFKKYKNENSDVCTLL